MAEGTVNDIQTKKQEAVELMSLLGIEGVLSLLMSRAKTTMTKEEYLSIAASAESILQTHAFNMADTVSGIAGLVQADELAGNFRGHGDDVAHLLYGIAENFRYLSAMGSLASDARHYARAG